VSIVSWLLERRGERVGPARVPRRVALKSPVSTDALGARVAIETLRRRHVRAILAIEHQVYPRPWTIGIFTTEIEGMANGDRHYIVALADGRLVGYAGMLFTLDEAHITNIAVDPSLQRSGVGTRLLLELLAEGRRRHTRNISLEVRASNVAAQAMYEAFGFTTAGIRPKYYENVEDANIMWCYEIGTDEYGARMREFWHQLEQR
jgi:[ribosomal protein S18]-alanine N-acetyltransferase